MHQAMHPTDEGLIRAIGPRVLAVNVFNLTVGASIFVLPGQVAAQLGPAAILAYLACSGLMALVFLCFAEVGSRVTRSGGAYAYIEEAFGPLAGFVASLLLWFGWNVLADAAIVAAMTDTLATVVPVLATPVGRASFIVLLAAGLAWVNIRGVETGVRVVVGSAIAKLVPLVLLVLVGAFHVQPQHLAVGGWPESARLGEATLLLFLAFSGGESALHASGEVHDPARTVPRGLAVGLGVILALYLALQLVAQGVLGPALAANPDAPLAAVARAVFGPWGAGMLLAASVVSMFATLSGDILATPRVIFASARDGALPAILSRVHPRYRTPHVSIACFVGAIGVLALSGTFRQLALLAAGSILVIYAAVSLSVLQLRRRDGPSPAGTFSAPGGPAVPIASVAVVGWLLAQLSAREVVGVAALAGSGLVLYMVRWLRAGGVQR